MTTVTLFFGIFFIGLILGSIATVFSTSEFDDRNYINLKSASVVSDELMEYCENNYSYGVHRYYYDAFGEFKAFKCTSSSSIESITTLQGRN